VLRRNTTLRAHEKVTYGDSKYLSMNMERTDRRTHCGTPECIGIGEDVSLLYVIVR
jgi:hypothetical protein